MLYWNYLLKTTCCLVITEEKSQPFWSNLPWILLTRQFGSINLAEGSQVSHIMVYGSNYLRKQWQTIHFFSKKYGKHDDHTMIMVCIMENMVTIPWSCHESSQSFQETWPPYRHHGMIMTMFRHDHGKIMAWQPCSSNPRYRQIFSAGIPGNCRWPFSPSL